MGNATRDTQKRKIMRSCHIDLIQVDEGGEHANRYIVVQYDNGERLTYFVPPSLHDIVFGEVTNDMLKLIDVYPLPLVAKVDISASTKS